jgi:hypothetical protein
LVVAESGRSINPQGGADNHATLLNVGICAQMTRSESAARTDLQIFLKLFRNPHCRKREIHFKHPRFEFIRVDRLPGIMLSEAILQVVGKPDIHLLLVLNASQDVYVIQKARLRFKFENSEFQSGLELDDHRAVR